MTLFTKKPTIVVHDGKYHADDLFAAATLMLVTGGKAKIIRTRDEDTIKKADFVADVGCVNDPATDRFDHHMPEGAGAHANGIPYAAFGLVWKKYGAVVCGSEEIAAKIEEKLVSPIDADDNGVALVTPNGDIGPYSMQRMFYLDRPTWRENPEANDNAFMNLVPLAQKVITREIAITRDALLAKNAVENAYRAASDKRIVELDAAYPYQETLAEYPEPLFVVAQRPGKTEWKVEAVRAKPYGFENRKNLPASWAGLRDEELAKASGVPDAVFCHRGVFLAVAKSREGALKLAALAIDANS